VRRKEVVVGELTSVETGWVVQIGDGKDADTDYFTVWAKYFLVYGRLLVGGAV
jgi:hypothetical protein